MSKYNRIIIGRDADGKPAAITVDVYQVLEAFSVTSSPLQHLIKKALCVGLRGHKDTKTDLNDILSSAKRAIEMFDERRSLVVQNEQP